MSEIFKAAAPSKKANKSMRKLELNTDIILKRQLRELLHQHDVTVVQIARRTGVPAKTIYHWLNGQKPSHLEHIYKLAKYFHVTIDYLIFGDGSSEAQSLTIKKVTLEVKDELGLGILTWPAKLILGL